MLEKLRTIAKNLHLPGYTETLRIENTPESFTVSSQPYNNQFTVYVKAEADPEPDFTELSNVPDAQDFVKLLNLYADGSLVVDPKEKLTLRLESDIFGKGTLRLSGKQFTEANTKKNPSFKGTPANEKESFLLTDDLVRRLASLRTLFKAANEKIRLSAKDGFLIFSFGDVVSISSELKLKETSAVFGPREYPFDLVNLLANRLPSADGSTTITVFDGVLRFTFSDYFASYEYLVTGV